MNWSPLTELSQLENIAQESANQPVLIFKHSTRCSISVTALSRLERSWNPDKAAGVKTYYLDLLNHRPISLAIAERFGVQHESPQALLIRDGVSVYDASHYDISFDDILTHTTTA